MRIEVWFRSVALAFAIGITHSSAHARDEERGAKSEESEAAVLPEHRVRPLPTDTFKPSEEISEDFAVPFPIDI